MKTFNLKSKYEAVMDAKTKLYVMDPTTITRNDPASETVGHPVFTFYSESWKLVDGKRVESCSVWEGRQNSWGMGSNHAGHLLTAIIAQRDAAIELLHEVYFATRKAGTLNHLPISLSAKLREALEPKTAMEAGCELQTKLLGEDVP